MEVLFRTSKLNFKRKNKPANCKNSNSGENQPANCKNLCSGENQPSKL
jgi:hypothetical protein